MSDAKRDRTGYPKGSAPGAALPSVEPAAALAADPAPAPPSPPVDPPAPVVGKHRLTRPHGFIDGDGRHRYWHAGDVLSDAAEIAMLKARGAPIAAVE